MGVSYIPREICVSKLYPDFLTRPGSSRRCAVYRTAAPLTRRRPEAAAERRRRRRRLCPQRSGHRRCRHQTDSRTVVTVQRDVRGRSKPHHHGTVDDVCWKLNRRLTDRAAPMAAVGRCRRCILLVWASRTRPGAEEHDLRLEGDFAARVFALVGVHSRKLRRRRSSLNLQSQSHHPRHCDSRSTPTSPSQTGSAIDAGGAVHARTPRRRRRHERLRPRASVQLHPSSRSHRHKVAGDPVGPAVQRSNPSPDPTLSDQGRVHACSGRPCRNRDC